MLVLPAAIGTFLLVNILCACVAMGVGFAAGVWFFGAKATEAASVPVKKPATAGKTQAAPISPSPPSAAETSRASKLNPDPHSPDPQLIVERTIMASHRLADVAHAVAGDVGDHSAKMRTISADLLRINRESSAASAEVATALGKILGANAELQQRLEVAENQIATQAAEIQVYESESRTDSLTGLGNRRAFDDELRRRLAEWQRNATPCSLVMLDIDHFKNFNDTHGHQAGDEALRQVAKVLKSHSREMDLPCRYGGEEFGVIFPSTAAAEACVLAERVRKAVENSATEFDGKRLQLTCSLGLSQLAAGDDVARLIRRADEGLYRSKEAGRNLGHWNNGENCVPIKALTQSATDEQEAPWAPALGEDFRPMDSSLCPDPQSVGRSNFVQVLNSRITESQRYGIPLSIMHVKIEDYEAVARNYGKAVSRQLADVAAPAIDKALREIDVVARLDHGEFLIMLPGSTHAEAGQAAKRMRITMNSCVVPTVDRELPVRFWHSIAELTTHEAAQDLLARARLGLIEAGAMVGRQSVGV